ncbi:MAG TPA: hypothetical protein PLP33_07045 [Leptospiraceae bacterium]|nr:hypothetical protein [Leptospiraceae bacterium]
MKIKTIEKNENYNMYETDSGMALVFIKNSKMDFEVIRQPYIAFERTVKGFTIISFLSGKELIYQIKIFTESTSIVWYKNLNSNDSEPMFPGKNLISLNNKISTKNHGSFDTFLSENEIVSYPKQLGVNCSKTKALELPASTKTQQFSRQV